MEVVTQTITTKTTVTTSKSINKSSTIKQHTIGLDKKNVVTRIFVRPEKRDNRLVYEEGRMKII
jgi:hypothetical protein